MFLFRQFFISLCFFVNFTNAHAGKELSSSSNKNFMPIAKASEDIAAKKIQAIVRGNQGRKKVSKNIKNNAIPSFDKMHGYEQSTQSLNSALVGSTGLNNEIEILALSKNDKAMSSVDLFDGDSDDENLYFIPFEDEVTLQESQGKKNADDVHEMQQQDAQKALIHHKKQMSSEQFQAQLRRYIDHRETLIFDLGVSNDCLEDTPLASFQHVISQDDSDEKLIPQGDFIQWLSGDIDKGVLCSQGDDIVRVGVDPEKMLNAYLSKCETPEKFMKSARKMLREEEIAAQYEDEISMKSRQHKLKESLALKQTMRNDYKDGSFERGRTSDLFHDAVSVEEKHACNAMICSCLASFFASLYIRITNPFVSAQQDVSWIAQSARKFIERLSEGLE